MGMDFQSRLLGLLDPTAALYCPEAHPYYKRKGKWPLQLNLTVQAYGIFIWDVLRTATQYLSPTPAFLWTVILGLCAHACVRACVCVCVNGSYTTTVSITMVILSTSVSDTCRFLCTSVPEQTGVFPGTLHFHFNSEFICVCQTKPLIHSWLHSQQGVLPFPTQAVTVSFFQSLRAPFGVFSVVSYI